MCIGSWNPRKSNHRDSPVDHKNYNYILHENAACTCTCKSTCTCTCKSKCTSTCTCTCRCTVTSNTLCSFYSLSISCSQLLMLSRKQESSLFQGLMNLLFVLRTLGLLFSLDCLSCLQRGKISFWKLLLDFLLTKLVIHLW